MNTILPIFLIAVAASSCRDSEPVTSAPTTETTESAKAKYDDGSTKVAGFTITSENAPKNDEEALRIVGIEMNPPPEVLHCDYEAGMDDSMRLVIRFPVGRADEFWTQSPWQRAKASRASGDGSADREPYLTEFGKEEWKKWMISARGWAANANLPDGEFSSIYVAEDTDADELRVFIYWHET